jgi:cytochrome c-type biogenesis protein CcsB
LTFANLWVTNHSLPGPQAAHGQETGKERTTALTQATVASILIDATLAAYIAATLVYLLYAVTGKKLVNRIASIILLAGLGFNIASIVHRWFLAGYAPVTNMYESMVLFGACIAGALLVAERVVRISKVGWLVALFAVLTISFASFYTSSEIRPLIPALQSNWLTVHVISYFCAYAVLTVSFVSSIVFFFVRGKPARAGEKPPGRKSASVTRKSIQFAFPLLTLGLLTGAVWAKEAWGEYWSWDPKETWSLITWLIYLNFLHLRYTLPGFVKSLGWKPESAPLVENIFAFSGYLLNGFTYLGVNYLLSGLHAYA